MFTIDTESGFENIILINSAYGLGENVVRAMLFLTSVRAQTDSKAGFDSVVWRRIGPKEL